MEAMQKLIILGSTGSIGQQTLEVIRRFPSKFKVAGLAGGNNFELLQQQIAEFHPRFIATNHPEKFPKQKILPLSKLAAEKCDLVVSAVSGVAGLLPTLAALEAGNDVALANKECLVLAGGIVMQTARKHKAQIFPVDSEHSGVWQLLEKIDPKKIRKVILTASGGSLRNLPLYRLHAITPREVLNHPTWQMGKKVTVDSATLANKAFEVIEAHHLFNLPYEKIEIVIHPQSIVHAIVETIDGGIFAQLANPDMRLPIQHALFRGVRNTSPLEFLELAGKKLEFIKPDFTRYPLFQTILAAAQQGGLAPAVAAIADEIAVEKFLAGEFSFPEMESFVKAALEKTPRKPATLKNILELIRKD
jgi:1-deoxy-D-xylulose-5-phosphate reductoisomerase